MPLASIAKILSLKNKTDLAVALNPARHLPFAGSARAVALSCWAGRGRALRDTPGCGPLIRYITNERKGPLRVAFAAALLRTTECLGDRWDGVTNSAVRFVRLPQLELSRM